jgi:hypothetical protein
MYAVAAIFASSDAARLALEQLRAQGVRPDAISLLAPGTLERDVERKVPIDDGEAPGMGAAVGGVVGGALGLATASLVFPGVGPVVVCGQLAAGVNGAQGGNSVGERLEERLSNGLPRDELALYQNALRRGRAVVIVVAESEERAHEIRNLLGTAGAESVDPAHADWAIGLHDPEAPNLGASGPTRPA